MAEFQWWLLLVGLVAGGGLVAVVFLDGARREADIDDEELPAEASWIAARLSPRRELQPQDIEAVLREHREYRVLPPPDRLDPIEVSGDPAPLAMARLEPHVQAATPPEPADAATGPAPSEPGR